jgi:hypothetical protein
VSNGPLHLCPSVYNTVQDDLLYETVLYWTALEVHASNKSCAIQLCFKVARWGSALVCWFWFYIADMHLAPCVCSDHF